MQTKLHWLLGSIAAAVIVTLLIGVAVETKACEAKGGKRLRGVMSSFQCYDAASLKVLP